MMEIQVYILTLEDVLSILKKSYKLVNIAIFVRGNNYREVRHGAKHLQTSSHLILTGV